MINISISVIDEGGRVGGLPNFEFLSINVFLSV